MEFLYEFLITDLFQCLSSPILVKYKYQDENRHKCKQPKCLGILELVVQVQVLGFKIGKNGAKKNARPLPYEQETKTNLLANPICYPS